MLASSNQTYSIAKQKLIHYCSYQERNIAEVRNALQKYKELNPAAIHQIIEELIQENFLNEKRYVESFVQGKFFIKKWGKLKIYHTLVSKHIEPKLIQQSLQGISDEAYLDTLQNLILKKKATLALSSKTLIRKKLINYLLQKGYEFELIQETLEKIV